MLTVPLLDQGDALSLSIALISDFQRQAVREGRMSPDALLDRILDEMTQPEVREIRIDEDILSFDSLALLDLVMEVNRFFNLHETGIEDYLFVRRTLGDWADLIAHHFSEVGQAAKVTFSTSGSTGTPKLVTLPKARLDDEIEAIAGLLPALEEGCPAIVSAVSPLNLYGFIWGVLLPRRSGRVPMGLYRASPHRIARSCTPGSIVLGTPYLFEKFITAGCVFPAGTLAVVSGAPATEATWCALEDLGLGPVIEVYGSTETGGVGSRGASNAAFDLLPHLRVTCDGQPACANGTPLPLQDRLSWTGARKFRVDGRCDRVVQVAGTNVDIGLVESAIMDTALVDGVAVRLDGERLKAFVIPRHSPGASIDGDLRRALTRLPAVARPDRITYGAALPRSDTGKLADW